MNAHDINDQASTASMITGSNHHAERFGTSTPPNRFTNLISGAASAFGNLQEEEADSNPASQGTSSTNNDSNYYSTSNNGAKGLAAALQLYQQQKLLVDRKQQIEKNKEEHKAQAHATQEDVHKKMKLVMSNPQLWLQFKSRLAMSDHGGGSVGVQKVLQEFLADHPEIEGQLQHESQQAALSTNANTKSRRISILETVSNFTSDLSNEASMRGSVKPASFPVERQKMQHQEDHEVRQERRDSNGSAGSSGDGDSSSNKSSSNFMNNASELGLSFLRRASAVATSSLASSSSSFNFETVPSPPLRGSTSTWTIATKSPPAAGGSTTNYAQPMRKRGSNKAPVQLSQQPDLLLTFNEQEEDGYISADDDALENDEMSALADEFENGLNASQEDARGA